MRWLNKIIKKNQRTDLTVNPGSGGFGGGNLHGTVLLNVLPFTKTKRKLKGKQNHGNDQKEHNSLGKRPSER